MKIIPFSQLEGADLVIDAVYEGSDTGTLADDPVARLLKVGNAGAFRYCGSLENLKYLVLFCSEDDSDWPDRLDVTSGIFTCYGDNRGEGQDLHDTAKKQNQIFSGLFESLQRQQNPRTDIPPLFLFSRHPTQNSPRSVMFRGVCVPGAFHLGREKGLSAVWRSMNSLRFQNYHAVFTVLDIPVAPRKWIDALEGGNPFAGNAPVVWNMWQKSGFYRPLKTKPVMRMRSVADQLPGDAAKRALLFKLYRYFNAVPARFDYFAAGIYSMSDPRVIVERVARSVDGGYEVFGWHQLGMETDPVCLSFVLVAKCYNPGIGQRKRKSIGVRETARLLSRIRNRQIGVLLTTSVITEQAYREARLNRQPLIFLCGSDIVDILWAQGIQTVKALESWLREVYPQE